VVGLRRFAFDLDETQTMPVNQDFAKWACSLSGCDGGDLDNSEIWISGIEWGYGKLKSDTTEEHEQKLKSYYDNDLVKDFTSDEPLYEKTYDIGGQTDYQFGRTFAKLYAAIHGHKVSDYERYVAETNGTEVFKLNLYPIAFPETADSYWRQYGLHSITGLETKSLYRTWCSLQRFPVFAELVRERKPKLIIGAGKTYLNEFALAFGGERGISDFGRIEIEPDSGRNGRARELFWGRIGEHSTLVVTPFCGRQQNLNSDYLVEQFGKEIRGLLDM